MIFEGIVQTITPEEKIGQNETPKVTVVLEENTDREYKSSIAVDFWGDKIELMKPYKEGDAVKVSLNFRSREYNNRHYTSISAWRVEAGDGSTGGGAPAQDDDLPF